MACLGERRSRRARLSRWGRASWRSLALSLLASPILLALGLWAQDPRTGTILITTGCVALFVGLLGATAKFSFLGFRWQPLFIKRDAFGACTSADLTKSYAQFAKLVVAPYQVKELIENAIHQIVIHCDELPSPTDRYSFGLCTIVTWLWNIPPMAPRSSAAGSPRTLLGSSATKALFTLDSRSRVLYVLSAGGYATLDEIAIWFDETRDEISHQLMLAKSTFDAASSA